MVSAFSWHTLPQLIDMIKVTIIAYRRVAFCRVPPSLAR
jgi:hypothetical protein